MKFKILIGCIAISAITATSCKKSAEQSVQKKNVNYQTLAKNETWSYNAALDKCVSVPNNCVPGGPLTTPTTYSEIVSAITHLFTNSGWHYTDENFSSAETASFCSYYGVTTTQLNAMGGYDFFNMVQPNVLTSTEFSDAVNDVSLTKTMKAHEADGYFDLLFGSKTDPTWVLESTVAQIP